MLTDSHLNKKPLTNVQLYMQNEAMNTRASLLDEIDAFLKANPDLSVTRFGLEAANDGKIVRKLRSGRDITLKKADAIRIYMDEKLSQEHTAA